MFSRQKLMGRLTNIVKSGLRRSICLDATPSVKQFDTHADCSEHAQRLGSQPRPLIASFLSDIGYQTPPKMKNDALWNAMLLKASETGVSLDKTHSQRCFEVGFTHAAISYMDHPLVAQVYIGIYTWLAAQIDDVEMREGVKKFPERFFAAERQSTLILQAFAGMLRSTHEVWDVVTAKFVVLSSLAFVNCVVLEERAEFQSMTQTCGGRRWPHYFRDREGNPEAYSYFTFPKAKYPDISMFLEAIPDMGRVINLANDVLSFYKEEVAGVNNNYIHQGANYESRDATAVLKSAANESIEATKRVEMVFEGRELYKQAWLNHLHGQFHMHRTTDRYKLHEIGLSEEKSCVVPPLVREILEHSRAKLFIQPIKD